MLRNSQSESSLPFSILFLTNKVTVLSVVLDTSHFKQTHGLHGCIHGKNSVPEQHVCPSVNKMIMSTQCMVLQINLHEYAPVEAVTNPNWIHSAGVCGFALFPDFLGFSLKT